MTRFYTHTNPKRERGRAVLHFFSSVALWVGMTILSAACMTAAAVQADDKTAPVLPCVFQPKAAGPQAAAAARIYDAAQGQARYLLGKLHPWSEDADLQLLTESRSAEHWVRPNTGTIEGLAFLFAFGAYDENVVGR